MVLESRYNTGYGMLFCSPSDVRRVSMIERLTIRIGLYERTLETVDGSYKRISWSDERAITNRSRSKTPHSTCGIFRIALLLSIVLFVSFVMLS